MRDYLLRVLGGGKNALYIYGQPGIGKTTVTKHVLNQFEDSRENAEILSINCEVSTPNLAMKEIHDAIYGESSKKLPLSEFVREILNRKIREKNFTLVLALDHFDRMSRVVDLL